MNNSKIAGFARGVASGNDVFGTAGSSAALAQATFKNYRCADGTQFIAWVFPVLFDAARSAARWQGGDALKKWSGVVGVALYGPRRLPWRSLTKAGLTTLKHAKRPVTACEQT